MAYEEFVNFFKEDSSLQTPQIAMLFVTSDDFDLEELRYVAKRLPYNSYKWYMTVYHYVFTRSRYMPLREKCHHEVRMRRCWREFQKSFHFVPEAYEVCASQGERKHGEPEVPPLPI